MSRLSVFGTGKKKYKNRKRLEIVRDLLSAASEKSKKTKIMYGANLSYKLLEKYLEALLGSGLLECVDNSFYVITWRGKEFLQLYADYVEQCRRIGDEIEGNHKDRLLLEDMCSNNESNSKRLENGRVRV